MAEKWERTNERNATPMWEVSSVSKDMGHVPMPVCDHDECHPRKCSREQPSPDLEPVRRFVSPGKIDDYREFGIWAEELLPALRTLLAEAEKLHQKIHALKTMSTVEMMCENESVRQHVTEWEQRCLKAEAENEKLREENATLEFELRHKRVTLAECKNTITELRAAITKAAEEGLRNG